MIEALEAHGGSALLAASLVLTAGALAVALTRRWDARQLTAELAIGTAVLAGLQAFAPLSLPGPTAEAPIVVQVGGEEEVARRSPAVAARPPSAPLPVRPAAVPATPPRPARSPWPWLALVGAALVALHRLLGAALVWRIHRRSTPAPADIAAAVDGLVARRVDTRVAEALRTASCYGLARPRLALPLELTAAEREAPLEAVLVHEAAHIRRRDPLRRALVASAGPLLFWNPLYWWLAREATECAEFIADEGARRAVGRQRYSRSLLALAAPVEALRPALGAVGSPFLRRRGELKRRLTMLHRSDPHQTSSTTRIERAGRTALATASLAVLTLGLGRAAQSSLANDPASGPTHQASARSYDVHLETRSAEALGQIVAHVAGEGAQGEWLGIRVASDADAQGQRHLVLLRGASVTSLRDLEAFAREAGVVLVSVKPSGSGRGSSPPANAASRAPVGEAAAAKDPLLVETLLRDPALTPDLVSALSTLQKLQQRAGDGTLGRLLQDETPSARPGVSTFLETMFIGFGGNEARDPVEADRGRADGPTFSLEAKDIPIADLIEAIAKVSRMNFIASPEVQGRLTVRFEDVPWREALEASVRALGFRVIEEGAGILRIAPETRVTPVR